MLPSQRTLRDYTHYVKASTGFSAEVDKQLMDAVKPDTAHEREKYVALVMDEMHLKENLVYDKHTGALIGFTDLGDTNQHLLKFQQVVEGSDSSDIIEKQPLANSMFVIMVRGLLTSLQFPYAQFPCIKVTGDLLFGKL